MSAGALGERAPEAIDERADVPTVPLAAPPQPKTAEQVRWDGFYARMEGRWRPFEGLTQEAFDVMLWETMVDLVATLEQQALEREQRLLELEAALGALATAPAPKPRQRGARARAAATAVETADEA